MGQSWSLTLEIRVLKNVCFSKYLLELRVNSLGYFANAFKIIRVQKWVSTNKETLFVLEMMGYP